MRKQSDTTKDPTARLTPRVPWRVESVKALPGHRLAVVFADGTAGEVDVSRIIFGPMPGVFAVLRDPALFAQVGIELGAVTWPGELDLAPDAMYDEIKAHGSWTPC
ncbi:MAG: DUF2442 domain-containing protein [Gemmatimonadota bacterium]